jgi:hypothetical protein
MTAAEDERTEFQQTWDRLRYPVKVGMQEILGMQAGHYVAQGHGQSRWLSRQFRDWVGALEWAREAKVAPEPPAGPAAARERQTPGARIGSAQGRGPVQ